MKTNYTERNVKTDIFRTAIQSATAAKCCFFDLINRLRADTSSTEHAHPAKVSSGPVSFLPEFKLVTADMTYHLRCLTF